MVLVAIQPVFYKSFFRVDRCHPLMITLALQCRPVQISAIFIEAAASIAYCLAAASLSNNLIGHSAQVTTSWYGRKHSVGYLFVSK